jgi:hypothetical protein
MPTSNRSVSHPCSARVSATSQTAVYGPVRTVVWEGRSREAPPYPDLWPFAPFAAVQQCDDIASAVSDFASLPGRASKLYANGRMVAVAVREARRTSRSADLRRRM